MTIDEMIKATKLCTKALMRLSYIDFCKKENQKEICNKIKTNPINFKNYG
jgi:hypothetical protein